MKQTAIGLGVALAIVVVAWRLGSAAPEQDVGSTTIHRFDDVFITAGPVVQTAEFEITNDRDISVEVDDIVTSCGCLMAGVADESLDPGQTTILTVTIQLSNAGLSQQTVDVLFSDGVGERFMLQCYARLNWTFAAYALRPYPDSNGEVPVFLVLVDAKGPGTPDLPSVGNEQSIEFYPDGEWTIIERHTEVGTRPTRQIVYGTLDVSGFDGEMPVEVELVLPSGESATVSVRDEIH